MRRSMFRVLLALSMTIGGMKGQSRNAHDRYDSGTFLYNACQLKLKAINHPNSVLKPIEAADALICQSYIEGYTDGLFSATEKSCMKIGTQEDYVKDYVSFMTKYPLFLKEDKLMGVSLALSPRFKCESQKR